MAYDTETTFSTMDKLRMYIATASQAMTDRDSFGGGEELTDWDQTPNLGSATTTYKTWVMDVDLDEKYEQKFCRFIVTRTIASAAASGNYYTGGRCLGITSAGLGASGGTPA